MSDVSAVLALPYIQPSQAQKHVTHNEALRVLDVIVQLTVLDRSRTVAPSTAAVGDRHIVAAGATGVWAGQGGAIAVFDLEGWVFFAPQPGWRAEVLADSTSVVFSGSGWVAAGDLPQRFVQVGVNAAPDAVNRLSVSAAATLFNHAGGGHQLKLNKAAAGDTASLLFQTGFSGRAELGLAGNDDFSVKVSPDGSGFAEALRIASDGSVALPQGAVMPDGTTARPALRFVSDPDTGLARPGPDQIALVCGGQSRATLSAGGLQVDVPVGGTGTQSASHDATAGRLARVFQTGGVFGLGVAQGQSLGAALVSANAVAVAGWYRTDAATTGLPVAAPAGVLEVVQGIGGDAIVQRWTSVPASGAARSWQRHFSGGVWQAWALAFDQASLLGPVTQTGGVPTGAVIERGTAAAGEFVRFADGTQICTAAGVTVPNASTASGSLFRSATVAWTFPRAFAVAPTVSGSVQDGDCWLAAEVPTAAAVSLRAVSSVTKAAALTLRAMAVGRWV
jgi:hypothetical protein